MRLCGNTSAGAVRLRGWGREHARCCWKLLSLQSRSLSQCKMQSSQPVSVPPSPQPQPSSSGGVGRGWEDIYSPLSDCSYLTEPSASCPSAASEGSGLAAPCRQAAKLIQGPDGARAGLGHPGS